MSGTLFVVSAPSGAGKTSLVKALVQALPSLCVSVSYTSRTPRPSEKEGIDYQFVSLEKFQQLIASQEFLEHAQVFHHAYGTSRGWVEQRLAQDQDVILEIDWQGARQIRNSMPEVASIFILPPSRETLAIRLKSRGQDDDSVIRERLNKAKSEISHYNEYDYLVINQDFEQTLTQLKSIIEACRLACSRQEIRQSSLIKSLLATS